MSGRSTFRVCRYLFRVMRFAKHGSLTAIGRARFVGDFRKHTGLYVYRREVLLAFASGRSRARAVGVARTTASPRTWRQIKRSRRVRLQLGWDTMAGSLTECEKRVRVSEFSFKFQVGLNSAFRNLRLETLETRNLSLWATGLAWLYGLIALCGVLALWWLSRLRSVGGGV